jgi:hypothetical protein
MAFRAMRAGICRACEQVVDLGYCDYAEDDNYGTCGVCGGTLAFHPEGFVTDVYGQSQYSDAVGGYVTSSRDRDQKMRNVNHSIGDSGFNVVGYEPCGDKVGGARPDHSLKNSAFSGGGMQSSRTSTGERSLLHKATS